MHLLRILRPVDIVAALYATAYYVWLGLRQPGTEVSQAIGSAAFYPLGIAVAWAYWRASRVGGLDTRTRLAWQILVLSALLLWTSGTAWDLFLRALAGPRYPAWVDHIETVSLLLLVPAFLVFPGRSFKGPRRTRLLLDATAVALAASVVALYFAGRLWGAENPAERSLAGLLRGPGMDWLILAVAAVGAVQKRDPITRRVLGLLLLASTSYVIGNYYYTLGTGAGPGTAGISYQPGNAVDGLWFAAWALRWAAARWSWYAWSSGAADACDGTGNDDDGFSYLVVAACFILVTGQVFSDDPSFGLLSISALVTTVLMLARQFAELRENRRLLDAQAIQEARFRLLVERSSDAVLILDRQGVVAYASETAPAVFGAGAGVCEGVRLADVILEDDRAVLESALAGRDGSGRLVLHVPSPGEGLSAIEAVWTDQRTDPAVNGIVVNCRDITSRRELERQLQHAQKLDAVGQLAGGLAHDINNSLAIVRGYAELLKDDLAPGSAGASDLSHIQHAVDRAAAITRKVLAFSRRQVAQPTVLDLSAVVTDILPLLRQSATPQVEIALQLEPAPWAVRADRGQLEQVLVNLATNARDAMPQGGSLSITTANRSLDDAAAAEKGLATGDYVELAVRDQGSGMTAEVRRRIFEPFFSTKTSAGGMGLGLAMVHDIVQACHGHINVDSAPGRGSTFTILMPRTQETIPTEVGASARTAPALGKTVLVVDDEDNVRVVARRMLERHGYSVLEAAGGAEACEILSNPATRLDVLLTDLVMPGFDGRQLIVRCAAIRPMLATVCMTGFAGEQDGPLGLVGRQVALLSKPFSLETLLAAVGAAASRSAKA